MISSYNILFVSPQSRFFLGDVGNGAAMKLVVSMVMGRFFSLSLSLFVCVCVCFAVLAIRLLLCEKIGLDPSVLVEVVSQGAIGAPMF
ncbi:hypothetical protein RHSIM_Rhsim01G0270300 [Rhododendron simsii]|uniref:Uncharacterized protein n=1 Tax=Rhododendron simsii TaxID=118357 RepID=A0A834M023_RHOSS|nr:hypothetical protein RHSIM_Rhsim01G0270300 [Rhododendron simsii]